MRALEAVTASWVSVRSLIPESLNRNMFRKKTALRQKEKGLHF